MEGNEIEKAAEYKCQTCGCQINEGEAKTFGVCDNCWDAHYRIMHSMPAKKESLEAELTRANAKVEELSQWKEDQIKLWLPVIEFMQEQSNMKWGGSISEEVLKRLKETNDLYRKANGQ